MDAIALAQDALHALQSTPAQEEDLKGSSLQEDEASLETPTYDANQVCVTNS